MWTGCGLLLAAALLPRAAAAQSNAPAEPADAAGDAEPRPAATEESPDTAEESPDAAEDAGATPEAQGSADGGAAPVPAPAATAETDDAAAAPESDGGEEREAEALRAGERSATEPSPKAAEDGSHGFAFGSYGRIGIGTDLRGSTPEPANIVTYGSRIAEPNYVEADLYYGIEASPGVDVRTVTTLALADQMFHYTGEFEAAPALRNLYAEADMNGAGGLWIGSRMVRGDDIYLLDFWPLDELNILGGGGYYRLGSVKAELNVGANRLLDPFQYQEREVSDPVFGSQTIAQLDRQRFIANSKLSYRLLDPAAGVEPAGLGLDASLYFEGQALPAGSRLRPDDTLEALPRDYGYTVGGQLSSWGFGEGASHLNLFTRFSTGLAAYDELEAPTNLSPELRTFPGATEFLAGVSGNYEVAKTTLLLGGYVRHARDASPGTGSHEEGWEYIVNTRPHYEVMPQLLTALDLSYQVSFPRGLNPSELIAQDPAVAQIAPMLIYAPSGAGGYDRPHFRLLYRAAFWNEGARSLFAPDDPRRDRVTSHFLGLQAEWWFNSTYQ